MNVEIKINFTILLKYIILCKNLIRLLIYCNLWDDPIASTMEPIGVSGNLQKNN